MILMPKYLGRKHLTQQTRAEKCLIMCGMTWQACGGRRVVQWMTRRRRRRRTGTPVHYEQTVREEVIMHREVQASLNFNFKLRRYSSEALTYITAQQQLRNQNFSRMFGAGAYTRPLLSST